jgi:hypothetical protein
MLSTVSQSVVPAHPTTVDKKYPMWWHMLSEPEQLKPVATADPSRFGFTKMYSEDQWKQFSSDSDEKLLDIQVLSDLRAAPTAVLHALIPHDQWTLDK